MFYSETLLSKTGPLARVWLSANLERKLSKTHILQSNIESSVNAIVDQGQAPMALRLSGQLLLGVVRIYSRKARYLLDDCNEALMKLKMAFRASNNHDLPTEVHLPNAENITLPAVITDFDNFMPQLPDELAFLSEPLKDEFGPQEATAIDWMTQELPDTSEQERNILEEGPALEDDAGLVLDIGEDLPGHETSIHMGREAPVPRALEEELRSEDKFEEEVPLGLEFPEDVTMADQPVPEGPAEHEDIEEFIGGEILPLGGDETGFQLGEGGPEEAAEATPLPPSPERSSESPLSSTRSSIVRELDLTFLGAGEEEEPSAIQQAPSRPKRRKLLQPDPDTVLHNRQIKEQQTNREKILKPTSFLPRDPVLLALIEMQRSGAFVSNVLGDGRGMGFAPELRDLFSVETVRQSSQLKRKRDSGIADVEQEAQAVLEKMPRLEIGEEEGFGPVDEGVALGGDTTIHEPSEMIELPPDVGVHPPMEEPQRAPSVESRAESEEEIPEHDIFDDTTAPIVHPADSGPISLESKHAVHLLRDTFRSLPGGSPSASPSVQKPSILFQDLLPETRTTKSDATKMFFELLVLASKDALKVDQREGQLDGPIRIRAKRGLWGTWAEMGAGGEIASQSTQQPTQTAS
ncbi:MAG: sister chromatid cohesion protein 1 [Cirrosporium novae-zelandiae]|nr:MAG: sister chromatid cohesion protein 1 [Cirrosporium novae-zelandiae]